MIKPTLHHVNLKTTRLQEMIDWYGRVAGFEVTHRAPVGAWLTNDAANHRLALLAMPGLEDDPAKNSRTGSTTPPSSMPRWASCSKASIGCASSASSRRPASITA